MNSKGKIVVDRSGDLRYGIFYRFNVPFEDEPFGKLPGGSIVVARSPTGDEVALEGKKSYMWIELTGDLEDQIETNDCPVDREHVTYSCFSKMGGEACGGRRLSPIIPVSCSDSVVLTDELRRRVEALNLRGAGILPLQLRRGDSGPKLKGFSILQFLGRARLRLPKVLDAPNLCPFCGKSPIMCDQCGEWHAYCSECKKQMVIIESMHKGPGDKRIPFEEDGTWRVIEGNTWDGSDVFQAKLAPFASKRFIDWLLRIHAAPFYAEPVWFCVDGMSDQQKKWFEELQKPFEV